MTFDPVMLSRIQFAFTAGFHILFPTLSVGLALFLAIIEGRWLMTGDKLYLRIYQFWRKLFALTFGMGIVSGVVLSYVLGANFGPFIQKAGSVIGTFFLYEVLVAFFVEAGFLGVMLFGWDKVSPKQHYFATLMVMLGSLISSLAIMAANTWMQTPAGFQVIDGQYVVDSWWNVIFNPSYISSALHMVFASYLTTSFVIAGVSAWYLLQNRQVEISKFCFKFALMAAVGLSTAQIFLGDHLGLRVHRMQPLKTAAIEGIWDTQKGAPFLLFAIPDDKLEKNHFPIGIPKVASLLNTHSLEGELKGLKSVPRKDRPSAFIPFFAFRLMVGIGFLLTAISFYAAWLQWKGQLFKQRWFYWVCVLASPLGFIATLSGWLVTEVGRQPWVIYGWMRTTEAASELLSRQVLATLFMLFVVYSIIFSFYLIYFFRTIQKGPDDVSMDITPIDVIKDAPFKYLSPESSLNQE
jgi:cytochrome d ubiquinol oxidase subunit I